MPSTYTLNNGIELIATGEQSGTWGDTTNTNLGLLDTALDGQVTVTLPSAGTSGSPNTLAIADGSASDGRNRMVIFNDGGDLGATAYVQLTPNDAEKIIYVRNDLAGSRSIILFQGTYNASNDYELPAGTTAVIYFDGAGSGAVAANVFNNAYFDSLRLGSVSVTAILDEDDMSSDSATALATQQSIKAYVDTQITAEDLDFAGDSGTGAVDLDSQTFTIAGTTNEIETSASGQTLTIGLPDDVTIAGDLTVDTDTLFVDASSNRVGINDATPSATLNVLNDAGGSNSWTNAGSAIIINEADSTRPASIKFGPITASEGGQIVWGGVGGDGPFIFRNYSTERVRFDEDGRVLIATASTAVNATEARLQFAGTTKSGSTSSVVRYSDNSGPPHFFFGKTRSTTIGTVGTSVSSADTLGYLAWAGDDGTDIGTVAAAIDVQVDGTPGTNDMPGRMRFFTTADGSQTPAERMRIDSQGFVGIGTTSPSALLHASSSTGATAIVEAGSGYNSRLRILSGNESFLEFGDAADSDVGEIVYSHSSNSMRFNTNATEAMRIDSSQRVLIGDTTGRSGFGKKLEIMANDSLSSISLVRASNSTGASAFLSHKARGTLSTPLIVQDDDNTLQLTAHPYDGTDYGSQSARISMHIDGTPGANDTPGRIMFETTADGASTVTERMRISQNGNVGIDTTNPSKKFVVSNSSANGLEFSPDDAVTGTNRFISYNRSTSSFTPVSYGASDHRFLSGDSEKVRIDTSGRVLIGEDTSVPVANNEAALYVGGTTTAKSQISVVRYANASSGPVMALAKSRSSTNGSVGTVVQDDDFLGLIYFAGDDGTDFVSRGAQITGEIDGTPGSNDMPGRLVFSTTADGSATPTERMRITNDGKVLISSTGGGTPGAQLQVLYNDSSTTHSAQGQTPNGLRMYNANTTTNALTSISFAAPNAGTALASINMVNLNAQAASTLALGDLTFSTKQNGQSTQYERMRIKSDGATEIKFGSSATTIATFGNSSSVNGVAGSGFQLYTPLSIARDSGTSRSAWFAGHLKFDDGYGIDFSATGNGSGTMSSEVFDDYEEGSWTPNDGTSAGLTLTINHASYTKIGRVVHVKAYILIPANSATDNIRIGGLPYTNASNNGWCPALLTTNASLSETRFIRARANEATLDVGTSEGDVAKPWSDYSNSWMIFSLTYST